MHINLAQVDRPAPFLLNLPALFHEQGVYKGN